MRPMHASATPRLSLLGQRSPLSRTGAFVLTLTLLISSGCTTTTTAVTKSNNTDPLAHLQDVQLPHVAPQQTSKAAPDALPGSIPVTLLDDLLTAEFAGQRQHFQIAVEHYLSAARQTEAEEITARAARVARFAGNSASTREAANLWLSTSPDNIEAHQLLIHAALSDNTFQEAIQHTLDIKRITGQSQFELFTARLAHMSTKDKKRLQQQLSQLLPQHAEDVSLITTIGVLAQSQGQIAPALEHFDQALLIQADYQPPAVMKARLLVAIKRNKEALSWLNRVTRQHPNHKGMKELQAQVLLRLDKMEQAFDAYSRLYQRYPDDHAVGFTLALLSIDRDMPQRALGILTSLLQDPEYADRANYYLGLIAIDDERHTQALAHFKTVQASPELVPATAEAAQLIDTLESLEAASQFLDNRIEDYPQQSLKIIGIKADLLSQHDHLEQALQTYDQGLTQAPDDVDLLYGRAMLHARLDNLQQLEADLKKVIQLAPNNANALNALGYTLADKTDRTEEALALIRRAFVLAPHSAAVSDSLGWAYFRLGNFKQAEKYLKRAYTRMPDPEIAAHYGELLWVTQRHKLALRVWKNSLKDNPGHPVLKEALERLEVSLP